MKYTIRVTRGSLIDCFLSLTIDMNLFVWNCGQNKIISRLPALLMFSIQCKVVVTDSWSTLNVNLISRVVVSWNIDLSFFFGFIIIIAKTLVSKNNLISVIMLCHCYVIDQLKFPLKLFINFKHVLLSRYKPRLRNT